MEHKLLNNSKNITIANEEEYTYSFLHCLEMWLSVCIIKPHNGKILPVSPIVCMLFASYSTDFNYSWHM